MQQHIGDPLPGSDKQSQNIWLQSFAELSHLPNRCESISEEKEGGAEGVTLYRTQGRADENFSDTNKNPKTKKKMQL